MNTRNKTRQNSKQEPNSGTNKTRRRFLQSVSATGVIAGLAGCTGGSGGGGETTETTTTTVVRASESDPLIASTYGGAYKQVLDAQLFKPFEEDTGIPIQTQAQPNPADLISQLTTAVQGGTAPVDVLTMTVPGVLRGINADIWYRWNDSAFDNVRYIAEDLNTYADGDLIGVGAQGWFLNLVHNTEEISDGPTSWTALWDDAYEDMLGLMTPASVGYLLDITAGVHFDGAETLQSQEGIEKVFEKLAGVKPQAEMWYSNQANFQKVLKSGNTPAGMLYNDVTIVLQNNGAPVETYFPEEGALLGGDRWVSPKTTDKPADVKEFIEYASRPEVQDRVSRNLFTVPTLKPEHSNLSQEINDRIVGPGIEEAIRPYYPMYVENQQFINQKWSELIVQG